MKKGFYSNIAASNLKKNSIFLGPVFSRRLDFFVASILF